MKNSVFFPFLSISFRCKAYRNLYIKGPLEMDKGKPLSIYITENIRKY